ncbi:MAG: PH domain-containing protein [Actinomycetota bacterium]|nr:MAG: PH domain-containing protein [Actinomycetota bacterium]
MGYPARLLGEGETIEFEMKPHWRALLPPLCWLLGVIFVGVFLWTKWGDWFSDSDAVRSVGRWAIFGVAVFILIVWTARPFIYWLTTDYVFTNRRIIVRTGFIARQGRDMPLSKVNNVSFDITVLGRILNYGRLSVVSASDEPLVINDVPSVETIQREVNRLHEEDDEMRRRRGGWTPDN